MSTGSPSHFLVPVRLKPESLQNVAFCALLVACFSLTSNQGLAPTPDSHNYFEGARSLAAGNGYQRLSIDQQWEPQTHFPPGYAVVLTPFEFFGADLNSAVRIIHCLTFVAIPLMIGRLYAESWGGERFWIATFWAASLFPFLQLQVNVATEGLFLVTIIPAWTLFLKYLEDGNRRPLMMSGILFGLSLMVRYAGIFLIPFSIATILLLNRKDHRQRFLDAILHSAVIIAPFALLALRNSIVGGSATNREFAIHWPTIWHLRETITVFSQLFIPKAVPSWLRIPSAGAIYVSMGVGAYRLLRNEGTSMRQRRVLVTAILWLLSYAAMLFATVAFVERTNPTDIRLWSPAFPAVMLIALTLIESPLVRIRKLCLCGLGILLALQIWHSTTEAMDIRENGFGYAHKKWTNSPTVQWVRNQPYRYLYSNCSLQLFVHAREGDFFRIPAPSKLGRISEDYESEVTEMIKDIRTNGGWIVIFTNVSERQAADKNIENIMQDQRLSVVREFSDGIVYSPRTFD